MSQLLESQPWQETNQRITGNDGHGKSSLACLTTPPCVTGAGQEKAHGPGALPELAASTP